ncbi:MAG: tRNA (N6-isopentenyl adenosine(37)-C2)-methylthiotransferase MiaB [Rhodospirillales bacterium]|nr:tRNA (N6-isopentenyl adenosine(37)-C2)-methylthiotransferase MiaB [Rhodospirillales bacterium]
MAKRLFIKNYGCQMNVYDAARMADVMAPHGYEATGQAEDADLIILNTCHIREKAAEKVYSELGRLRILREERAASLGGPAGPMIAVGGCVAQAEGEELLRRAPFVDVAFGPQTYHRLPEMVERALRDGGGVGDTDFPVESKFDFLPEAVGDAGSAAFLTIQEGCDKFCSFCVVPYTRGSEYSRPVEDVLAEARGLVARGAREITLLGQNVNAYHGAALSSGPGGDWTLGRLVRSLAEINGLLRIRYTTSHPRDMDDDLIAAHGELPRLMPYLHLPVQSGSDRMLAAMNRGHDVAAYLRIIEKLRKARPDIALSSDFIVGHPGETDADFQDTMALISEVEFAQAYSFKYSRRPGTPGAVMPGQLTEDVKSDRLGKLQDILNRQQIAFNEKSIGRTVPVLFDRPGARPNQILGRSPHMQAVYVTCNTPRDMAAHLGKISDVRINAARANSLAGSLPQMNDDRNPATEISETASV